MNTRVKKRIFKVLKILFAALLLFIAMFPVYWLVAMAIRETDEMRGHIPLLPQSFTLTHFMQLFSEKGFGTALWNSVQTTFGSLIISLLVGVTCSYILARSRFRFGLKKPLTYWVLLVRVLPPIAFTIPLYIMFNKFGILTTRLPVLLACVLINVPLIVWFLVSFFRDLPEEIEESCSIDGAGRFRGERGPFRIPLAEDRPPACARQRFFRHPHRPDLRPQPPLHRSLVDGHGGQRFRHHHCEAIVRRLRR